jgi:hypothetical protein
VRAVRFEIDSVDAEFNDMVVVTAQTDTIEALAFLQKSD